MHIEQAEIVYGDKISSAEEFLYVQRRALDLQGVFIYTKPLNSQCHQFSCVDLLTILPKVKKARKWVLTDASIPCSTFDSLMSFAIQSGILQMPSLTEPLSVWGQFNYVIGVRSKSRAENWYQVVGGRHSIPEHQEIVDALLVGEVGQRFREMTQGPSY